MAAYMRKRRADRRNKLIEMSGGQCASCGSTDHLEFNHTDLSNKLFTLSGAGLDKAWATILVEWEKCELLCSSCHLDYTRWQYSANSFVAPNKNHDAIECGTMRGYQEKKCRCKPCKAAKAAYRRKEISYST